MTGLDRRTFLRSALGAGLLATSPQRVRAGATETVSEERLIRAAEAPALRVEGLTTPVTIASMELLRNGRNFLVRVRSKAGDEAVAVPNAMRMVDCYPVFVNR